MSLRNNETKSTLMNGPRLLPGRHFYPETSDPIQSLRFKLQPCSRA
jgi:hypothetical protein